MMLKFSLLLTVLWVSGNAQQQPVKMCVLEELSSVCQQMAQELPETWACVTARDKLECARLLEAGEVDLVNMDSRALYVAGKYFQGVPIATELVDGQPHRYEGVALVKKDSDIRTPEDLRGRRSCHTGVGRTVGWQLPIAALMSRGIMQPDCQEGELKAVENFFSGGSCAPGNWSNDPIVNDELKARYRGLCKQCSDPATCRGDDLYAGYEGAVRCLLNGAGDVAFTKVPVLLDLLKKDPTIADNVELLCLEGDRRQLKSNEQEGQLCVWGFRPSNAFVTSRDNYARDGQRLLAAISTTTARYPPPHVRTPEWYYKVFLSGPKITNVLPVDEQRRDYRGYLGDFIYAIEKPQGTCEPNVVSYCVTSEDEKLKCQDYAKAASSRGFSPSIECVVAVNKAACMELLKQGNAKLVTLDGGDVYTAGRYYGLQPISAELYGNLDATYYSVAVIRSASDVTKLSELKGLRSCHTGIGRTAGWVVPVGALLRDGDIDAQECNRAAAVAAFFEDGSCVPGANDTKFNPGRTEAERLCRQCIGDEEGRFKCSRDSKERYSGYAGAFRCLAEGRGDVAFVKHSTVPQYTDGQATDSLWSRDLLSSDFQLLCGQGGTAPVEQYLNCNLAKVPSHYVMTGGEVTVDTRLQLARLLADSAKFFSDDSDLFRLFAKYGKEGKADLLFKDSATGLKADPLRTTYVQSLGEDFLRAAEAADPKACPAQR